MRYSTPVILFKYLQYYFVAANSKGHGIHSPFVFKLIQEQLNATSSIEEVLGKSPEVKKVLHQIEFATPYPLPLKIKILIARLLQKFNPSILYVSGRTKQLEEHIKNESVDMAFIGGGISKAAILDNATMLLDKMHVNSWMILHGIHADSNMEAAWNTVKKHANVRLTIDLFNIGILFCRKEQKEQEHFIIRY
jgi:hypothetical protein